MVTVKTRNQMYKSLMKYLTTNQNFYKSKLPLLHVFRGLHEFSEFKKYIYVKKAKFLIFDIFH